MTNERDITRNNSGGNPFSVRAFDDTPAAVRTSRRKQILETLYKIGPRGAICDEVQDMLGGVHQSDSPRWSELKRDGAIIATGEERQTRRGKWAQVMMHAGFANVSRETYRER